MYVYAPAGALKLRSSLLESGVKFIGSQQYGVGSNWSKGKRYIRKCVNCSGTAIKRACVVKCKVIHHDYNELGLEVYYFHKDYSARIVKAILDYLVLHIDDPELPQSFSHADFKALLNMTYSHRISQLRWVCVQNYQGQGNAAEQIYNLLNNLK
jgi:hypothetical protein